MLKMANRVKIFPARKRSIVYLSLSSFATPKKEIDLFQQVHSWKGLFAPDAIQGWKGLLESDIIRRLERNGPNRKVKMPTR